MCIRDSLEVEAEQVAGVPGFFLAEMQYRAGGGDGLHELASVSYTHLRAHETVLDLVCRLLLEKKQI